MKKFLFPSILRKLPLFIITIVVLCGVGLITATGTRIYNGYPRSSEYYGGYSLEPVENCGILPLLIVFAVIITVLPIFSMNYRYSLAKADTFRQAPFKARTIRYAEHLSTLVIMILGFTVAYLLFVGILGIRYTTESAPNDYYLYIYYTKAYFDFGYFVPLYFFTILCSVAQYFISYLIISRCNCMRNSAITLIFGLFALCFFMLIVVLYSYGSSERVDMYSMSYANATPVLFVTLLYNTYNRLILGFSVDKGTVLYNLSYEERLYYQQFDDGFAVTIMVLGIVSFIILAVLGMVAFFAEKDPSGEYAGKSYTEKPYQEIIFHVGIAVVGAIFGSAFIILNLLSYFIFLLIYVGIYYPVYGTLNRNFKLKPYQFGLMIGVIFVVVLINIIANSISYTQYAY